MRESDRKTNATNVCGLRNSPRRTRAAQRNAHVRVREHHHPFLMQKTMVASRLANDALSLTHSVEACNQWLHMEDDGMTTRLLLATSARLNRW